MLLDATYSADQIHGWVPYFDAVPPRLTRALAVLDALTTHQPPTALPDVGKLTPANAGRALDELAAALPAQQAYADARRQLLHASASEVLAAAADAVPALLQSVEPTFRAAVNDYVDAVDGMPLTLHEVVASHAAAFNTAVRCEATLNSLRGLMHSTGSLPGFLCNSYDRLYVWGTPSPEAERAALTGGASPEGLSSELYALATLGCEWELRTARDAELARSERLVTA